MGLFDLLGQQHEQVQNSSSEHDGSLSHELIAGAASFEAIKAYNKHCEKQGKPVDHATAKALLAGFAGSMVDKLVETKGLDYLDKQKAKRHAEHQVKDYYENEHQ